MHNIIKSAKILTLLFCGICLIGCESDDNSTPVEGTNSIVNYLEKDSTFSIFSAAIDRAGLKGGLDGNSGTYTVLAPDNDAMEAYLQSKGYQDITDIPTDTLKQLVNYHILDVLTPKDNFITSYIPTLAQVAVNDSVEANLSIFVSTIDSVEFNGYSSISEPDIQVDNGVLHKINHTLGLPTIKTFMKADSNLKPFYDRITASGISTDFEDIMGDPNARHTILVPNENAVQIFFDNDGAGLNDTQLNQIYRYHLLDTLRLSTNLRTSYILTKSAENYSGNYFPLAIYVNAEEGLLLNGFSNVVISDLMTINGNIQVLDKVLTLPSLKTFIASDIRFESFKYELNRDDQAAEAYMDLLSQSASSVEASFTVFAPDNDAFDDVLRDIFPDEEVGLDDIETDSLTNILNLHIHKSSALKIADFTDQDLSTLGEDIHIQLGDTITIKDPSGRESRLLDGDIQAKNGVLHHIDQVLLPNN